MTQSTVEVVYALPQRAQVVTVTLEAGSTVLDAVHASGIAADYAAVAIFGEPVAPGHRLRDGDRIELLRLLAVPPMEARRRRAARSAKR